MNEMFSIIDQPCLPVQGPEGRELWSLRHVLTRAHDISGLALPPALECAVTLGLVLPTVIDAHGLLIDEDAWGRHFDAGRLDAHLIDAHLDRSADRLNLFDGAAPFQQTPGLEASNGKTKPASALIASAATGNNVPLFTPIVESTPMALRPEVALWWLLFAMRYDVAGIKSGAVGDPAVKGGKTTGNQVVATGSALAVVPRGRTYFETIMLNLPIGPSGRGAADAPAWRREVPTPAWRERHADGLLDLLTFPSRRIRLIPSRDDDGQLVVREVVITAGDRLAGLPDYDLHAPWAVVAKPKPGDPPNRPRRVQSGRLAWEGLDALLADARSGAQSVKPRVLTQVGALLDEGCLPPRFPLSVTTFGVEYGTQSAVVTNMVADSLPIPLRALVAGESIERERALAAADDADRIRVLLNRLANQLREFCGGDATPFDKGQRPGDAVARTLDAPVRAYLQALRDDPADADAHRRRWQREARVVAESAAEAILSAAPNRAFKGRHPGGDASKPAQSIVTFERFFRVDLKKQLPDAFARDATESTQTVTDEEVL